MLSTTPIYGNYHGYYTKRPIAKDERLALLPHSLFKDALVLDVGCNEGWITCEIAQSLEPRKVVGVDIDDSLIRAAWKRRRTVWSLQEPVKFFSAHPETNELKRKREQVPSHNLVSGYFPLSLEHTFGPLPIPPASVYGSHTFPHNVIFRTADWVQQAIPEDAEGYNVVLALSISKWVHLNGGDDGIRRFFQRVYDVLKPDGSFVLEPQAWSTYAKAKRMDKKLKENAKHLIIRPEHFESVLQEIGFGPARHLGTTGEGGFHRPLDVYTKQ